MKVQYKIAEDKKTIEIEVTPVKDFIDGLKIVYGKEEPMGDGTTYQPAITHDLTKDLTVYPLPPEGAVPGFEISTIEGVFVEDAALDLIKKW